jgi:hypothetical protein
VAIVIAFVVPCLLWLVSVQRCKDVLAACDDAGGDKIKFNRSGSRTDVPELVGYGSETDDEMIKTPYNTIVSNPIVMYITMGIGGVLFMFVLVENIRASV